MKTLIPNLRMHWPYFDRAELFKIVSSKVEYQLGDVLQLAPVYPITTSSWVTGAVLP